MLKEVRIREIEKKIEIPVIVYPVGVTCNCFVVQKSSE
jgi:hypothetical protein